MEEDNSGHAVKGSAIRQIVRLKEMLHKWQLAAASQKTETSQTETETERQSRGGRGGIPPAVKRRLAEVAMMGGGCESDDESSGCASPEDVPRGYLAVYVGLEMRRFVIPTSYLAHSLFKVLLEKAEEEFGFHHRAGLTIPCEIETFKYIINCIENHPHHHHNDDDHNISPAGNSFMED